MIRLIKFILFVSVVVGIAYWLADRPGTAQIVWRDTVIETSAVFLALCVLALAVALHVLFRIWSFLYHGPTFWRLRREINKIKSAQDQLTKGLVAIAAGRAAEAGRLAVAARKNVENGIAAQWLQAQAAQMAGDKRAAQEIFRALAAKDETSALGYRGLVAEAKRQGDWGEVDRLLVELRRKEASMPWLSLMRMESAARRRQWAEAEEALSGAVSAKMLDTDAGRRTRAALRVALSRAHATSGDRNAAIQAAEQAVKQAPDWLPAIINLAEALAASGHVRAAARVIDRAWKNHPHPQLARIVMRMAETPLEAFKHMERLGRTNENTSESCLAVAEAALSADVWGEARRRLMVAVNDRSATQGVYKLLARLERLERHDERAAAMWLAKALDVAPDPVWLCRVCGGAHDVWQPVCAHCGSFDVLEWRSAGKSRGTLPLLEKDALNGY